MRVAAGDLVRLLVATSLVVLLGCSAAPVPAPAANLFAHLEDCGLATAGTHTDVVLARDLYVPDACYRGCLAEGSCDELRAMICRTGTSLATRCDQRCAFPCPQGGIVPITAVCNGVADCMGGADELGCPGPRADAGGTFTCDGGRQLSAGFVCDGYAECVDGTDERGCPGDCLGNDGRWIGVTYQRCNGRRDCADGSDEVGCESFACDGTTYTWDPATPDRSPLCDGYAVCRDQSDERGCATISARCGP
jgi:hypothetical protein